MNNCSISLLRANPALTTNVKIVVDSDYNLYLESYSANRELGDKKYKKYLINSDVFLSERIASFYKGLPTDIAYQVKNDIKSDVIQNSYENQYDDLYYSGPRAVEDTRYKEEFQYNTTLKICPESLPKHFFIFRLDDPGLYDLDNINTLSEDFFNNLKVVKAFDLTPKTSIGKLWKKNYIDDDVLPRSSIELNFKSYEFSQWKGYDYYTGGSVSKSFFMEEFMQNQTTDFEFESFLIDGFRKNGVVAANYSNISFLFDDTVSGVFLKNTNYYEDQYPVIFKMIQAGQITDDQYTRAVDFSNPLQPRTYYIFNDFIPYRKKWTINRYVGFYGDDIKFINKVSPYVQNIFRIGEGIEIVDNVFKLAGNNVNPVFGTYNNQLPVYFKIDNHFYLVEKQVDENGVETGAYILISDNKINGLLDDFVIGAQKPITLVYEEETGNPGVFHTYLKHIDGSYFSDVSTEYFTSRNSVVMLKIGDDYYKLKKDAFNRFYLHTDEYVSCNSNTLFRKLGINNSRVESMQILTKDNTISYFEIVVYKFTEIGDWDYDRVVTKHAAIEYDKNDEISYNRPFLTSIDINDVALPKDPYFEKFYNIWIEDGLTQEKIAENNFLLPLASEYAASGDLYMLNNSNTLTRIWDINQSVVKWGLLSSINTNAYPYKINNSLDVSGVYNLTPNMYATNLGINDLNLDWFYTVGKPIDYDLGDFDTLYNYNAYRLNNTIHRTLNLDMFEFRKIYEVGGNINTIYKPDLTYYKNINATIDYFDFLFNTPTIYNDTLSKNLIHHNKISYLQPSDNVNGPAVYFKGFKAYVQWVDLEDPNVVTKFTTSPANELSGYGFVILFNARFTDDTALHGKAGIEIILNKKYKNMLVNIFIYTPSGSFTSLDYRERNNIYNEDIIKYTVYDSFTGITSWVDSELKPQALTLNNFINILNNNSLTDNSFSAGIEYTVIETKPEYTISSIMLDPLDGTNRTVKVIFTNDVNFKQGQWVYVQGTGFTLVDTNLQISRKEGNKICYFVFSEDMTTTVATIAANIADVVVTTEKQVLPFRFKISEPDKISIDKNVNVVVGDTSCPVIPANSFKTNTNIVVSSLNTDGLIPHVYVDDNINRRIFRQNLNKELSYSELKKLPTIYRFSGDYEPIIHTIDLFNKSKMDNFSNMYVSEYLSIATDNTLSLHLTTPITNLTANDFIYFDQCVDFPFLEYKTIHIKEIKKSTVFDPILYPNQIEIVLGFVYDTPMIPSDDDFSISQTFGYYVFKNVEKNITFEFDYEYFGISKSIIRSKVFEGVNPLKSSININNSTNKYPMIDEHGAMTVDINIFKSSWDLEYYFTTLANKYKIKT